MSAPALRMLFEPVPLDGGAGALFAVHYPPARASDRAVLHLPPFAEELNRARRMASLQARELAKQDIGTLILDPYGCGDSGGEFAEARWQIWRDDAIRAIAWLRGRGYHRITLLGLRLGALLALDVARESAAAPERLVLWQPVLRGDQMMTQFLRLRLAAELAAGARGRDGTAALRQQLATDRIIEIAGYELHHELVVALDALKLAELGETCPAPIEWIDVVTEASQPMSPAQEQVMARWRQAKVDFRHHQAVGEPFWTLQETTLAPGLVSLTSALLERAA